MNAYVSSGGMYCSAAVNGSVAMSNALAGINSRSSLDLPAAAVAEELGLPGIGRATAHLMTHKVAMRRELAVAGVPQPRFAAVRARREAVGAAETVGFPAVLKPADSGGQRGLFLLRSMDDL